MHQILVFVKINIVGELLIGPQSLFSLWTNRISSIHQARCREFNGRLEAGPGNRAELYSHMKEELTSGNVTYVQVQQSYKIGVDENQCYIIKLVESSNFLQRQKNA